MIDPQQLTKAESERLQEVYEKGELDFIGDIDVFLLRLGAFNSKNSGNLRLFGIISVMPALPTGVFFNSDGTIRKRWYDGSLSDAVRFKDVLWQKGQMYTYIELHERFEAKLLDFRFDVDGEGYAEFKFEITAQYDSKGFDIGQILNVTCDHDYYGTGYCPWQAFNKY
ncbi:hypothetical protein ABGV42_00540 [Paenibacillus pabuli]|uniref:hypothetical protein n=1 Tax=Paenibacillus pabuli TaxID=1472 RepID=UPI00324255FC